jgi:uncharacterized metal-binding protein
MVQCVGVRCSATGTTEAIIAQHANNEYMYEHLKLISAATEFGHHAWLSWTTQAGIYFKFC